MLLKQWDDINDQALQIGTTKARNKDRNSNSISMFMGCNKENIFIKRGNCQGSESEKIAIGNCGRLEAKFRFN